jgi:hypothetical protein
VKLATDFAQFVMGRGLQVPAGPSHLCEPNVSGARPRVIPKKPALARLSSSAKADDPVIAGRRERHRSAIESQLQGLLDARFRGHDTGEIA